MAYKIDTEKYLIWANNALAEGDLYKTLTYLARANCYSADINAFGLLIENERYYDASRQLDCLMQKYGETHNVLADINDAFSSIYLVAFSTEYTPINSSCRRYKGKINFDKDDLLQHFKQFNEFFSGGFFNLSSSDDLPQYEVNKAASDAEVAERPRFFASNSAEYVDYLNNLTHDSIDAGDMQKAYELFTKASSVPCNDIQVLMWKVDVLVANNMYDDALPYAELIYDKVDDAFMLSSVAEAIAYGCGNKAMLRACIEKLQRVISQLPHDRLHLMMRICTDVLADAQLASCFAKYIASNVDIMNSKEIKDTIRVLLINKDIELAKQLIILMTSAFSNDVWYKVVYWYCLSVEEPFQLKDLPPKYYGECALPRNIILPILTYLDDNADKVDAKYLNVLTAIIQHSNIVVRSNNEGNLHDIIISMLLQADIDDDNILHYIDFATNILLSNNVPVDIASVVLARLVSFGIDYNIYIKNNLTYDAFSTKWLASCDNHYDVMLTMCVCAVIGKVTKRFCENTISQLIESMKSEQITGVDCTLLGYGIMKRRCGSKIRSDIGSDVERISELNKQKAKNKK